MNAEKISQRWFVSAVAYFAIGLGLGVYVAASGHYALVTVHSHINLLGWVSMALIGLLYKAHPAAAQTRLAVWQFWLYQLATPVMLLAVTASHSGLKAAEAVAGIASAVLLVSALLFWLAIIKSRNA